ncbi:hypothetical protein ELY21_04620 [Legionella sp. km535]|uniref:DUF5638 domain-containing protein n=1 Tax=Legionella sp. km535 TaxID=2498107 RepID=UPI000F8E9704|nr:DUF5638 domain-containing protein [Legionella sp. km535]RUR19507.1 hypothetical protein ELY21_04620 [Legionella sp. km535]
MPYTKNTLDLNACMGQCNQAFDNIFTNLELTQTIEEQLRQVKSFYAHHYHGAKDKSTKINVLEDYQNLILLLSQVSQGELSADQALNTIDKWTEMKQIGIIIHNLITVCELMFWAAASALFYSSCISVGIPLLACDPISGLLLTLGSALLAASSIHEGFDCFEEFKTLDHVNNESEREKNLISFFSPPKANKGSQSLDSTPILAMN